MQYEARRRRSTWSDAVRRDPEIKMLDETDGEWILCGTCANHFEHTGRGRRPNDPLGFKVKMNGRFQEAAWVMHKSRVVAHRLDCVYAAGMKRHRSEMSEVDMDNGDNSAGVESDSAGDYAQSSDSLASAPPALLHELPPSEALTLPQQPSISSIQIPLSGWKCPGIVPNAFYETQANLVHAFAKYYMGSYRINVVRDIRTDRVLLFSHECENEAVQRGRQLHSLACKKCHAVWTHHKSFRRILKKMERYIQVEILLRRAWSLSSSDLDTLSKFKHASCANLNIEGRELRQAVIDVLRHYGALRNVTEPEPHLPVSTEEASASLSRNENHENTVDSRSLLSPT